MPEIPKSLLNFLTVCTGVVLILFNLDRFFLGLDLGTSAIKVGLFDAQEALLRELEERQAAGDLCGRRFDIQGK